MPSPPPTTPAIPGCIAVIMYGNRRWVPEHSVPEALGHARGAKRVRGLVEACIARGVRHSTVLALSTGNWKRPQEEVSNLMGLFMRGPQKETIELHRYWIRLQVISTRSAFDARLQKLTPDFKELTAASTGLTLIIAANYGSHWDMLQAMQVWRAPHSDASDNDITERCTAPLLCLGNDPNLLIRTSGELRISNVLL